MNTNAFRHLYSYHFAENRKIWDHVMSLTHGQFTQPVDYSRGSVREQVVHLIDAEDVWFSELLGVNPSEPIPPSDYDNRAFIRAHWDSVETKIRGYLDELQDEALFTKPIREPEEDKDLIVWQVLIHVVNHATDHRAQLLRLLNDLGAKTESQDYIFHVYDHPV